MTHLTDVMHSLPQDQWGSSNEVAGAYLKCPKVKGIITHLGFKMHLSESSYSDIMQNAYLILARNLWKLDCPENVYSYLYEIIRLSIYSIRSNSKRTEELRTEKEEGDEEKAIKPLADSERGSHSDHANDVIAQVDLENAKVRFSEKLKNYLWPDDIIRDPTLYQRLGRPRKDPV